MSRWFLGLTLAGLAMPALAQHPEVLKRLKEMDAATPAPPAAAVAAAVGKAAKTYAEVRKQCAPTVAVQSIASATGVRDILKEVAQQKVRNGWTVYGEHMACGRKTIVRYIVVQKPTGELVAAYVNEGRSHANISVMRDASPQAAVRALMAVRKVQPACDGKDMAMGATRILSTSKDLGPEIYGVRYTGSWTEIWRFRTCGRIAEVRVVFRGNGDDGGADMDFPADGVVLLPAAR